MYGIHYAHFCWALFHCGYKTSSLWIHVVHGSACMPNCSPWSIKGVNKKNHPYSSVFLHWHWGNHTVYPKKYAHSFVVLCFVVVMQSLIMNSYEVFIHIYQGCFAGTGAIVRLPQCQWSKPDGYGKISQCITTTKHSKAKTMCIFLGIYCKFAPVPVK